MCIYDAAIVIICVCERVEGGLGLGGTKKVVWKGKKRVSRGYNTVADGWAEAYNEKKKEKEKHKVRKNNRT